MPCSGSPAVGLPAPCRGVPAAGGVPVRRPGLLPDLAQAHGRPGRAAVRRPDRVRDDQARRRLGPGPLHALFDLRRGPSPAGARWRGLLVVAIDGTIMSAADSAANLAVYSKQRGGRNRGSGYPQLREAGLVSCGIRTVIDAVFRPVSCGETTCTPLLLPSLRAGMLLLADRNFAAGFLARKITEAEAGLPDPRPHRGTAPQAPRPAPPARRVPAVPSGGVSVRVIDAEITVATSAGRSPAAAADHHPDRPDPLPRRRPGSSLPRALGDRNRLPRAEVRDPRRPGPARAHPRRHRAGDLGPARHLPGPAHRHRRRRRHRPGYRP